MDQVASWARPTSIQGLAQSKSLQDTVSKAWGLRVSSCLDSTFICPVCTHILASWARPSGHKGLARSSSVNKTHLTLLKNNPCKAHVQQTNIGIILTTMQLLRYLLSEPSMGMISPCFWKAPPFHLRWKWLTILLDREMSFWLIGRGNWLKSEDQKWLEPNKHRREVVFEVGNLVFLRLQPYRMRSLARKLDEKLSMRF